MQTITTSRPMIRVGIARCGRAFLILLLCAALVGGGGCASTPAPPTPESRRQLGRVGVMALSSAPRIEFHTFAKGWAAGVAKGGAMGVADGLLSALAEAMRSSSSGPYAWAGTLIGAAVLISVSTIFYGVSGGREAVNGKTARQIEQELKAAIGGVDLAADLADRIHTAAITRPELDRYTVTRLDGALSGSASVPGRLPHKGVDTIAEVQITEAGFRGGSGDRPKVCFYMNAHIRLRAADDGGALYTREFQYLSRELLFSDWFADGARELVSGFAQAMGTLADRIVDELYVVTDFPFDSGLWAFPGQPEFGTCWFRPIYPKLEYTSLWHSIRHNAPGIQIRFTKVDALQPVLAWEAFPRPRDCKPGNESLLKEISNVTYDLKLWEAVGDFPARLVYDMSGLYEPRHRLAFPLKPATPYFWTFRARYELSGQPQVTRWAFSNIPSNVPSDYPQRRAGGTCDLEAIPSTNYFRFITP